MKVPCPKICVFVGVAAVVGLAFLCQASYESWLKHQLVVANVDPLTLDSTSMVSKVYIGFIITPMGRPA